MAPPVPLSSIPTISDLYKTGELFPTSEVLSIIPSSALNTKISLLRTSITTLATTSIVNAANESLLGGGGVDGAIHAAAGPGLVAECRTLNGCKTGSAKITSAHDLPCDYVIHAVGPVYARAKRQRDGLQAELLGNCYAESLELARQKGGSVAFSCLSTGVYGYPSGEAAEVVCGKLRQWLEEHEGEENALERVVICCFEAKDERAYKEWLPKLFPPTDEELPQSGEKTNEKQEEVDGSAVIVPRGEDDEPKPKKAKTDSQEAAAKDDWEDVEKPGNLEKSAEMSDEGEKIEGVSLAESDGEKVEKPKEDMVKSAAGYELVDGGKETENRLGTDW